MGSKQKKKYIRILGWILFVIYMLLLLYFLFFAEWYGRETGGWEEYRINTHLFREIHRYWVYRDRIGYRTVFLNLAGNVIGFIPFGFILPVVRRRFRHVLVTVPFGFVLSFLVECGQQVFRVGSFDVDDILLNTCGAFLGYLCFVFCDWLRRKR